MIETERVGGIFLSGGKNGGYFGVVLELFKGNESRWVVKSLFNSDKFSPQKKEEEFIEWVLGSNCSRFVTDVPTSKSFVSDVILLVREKKVFTQVCKEY